MTAVKKAWGLKNPPSQTDGGVLTKLIESMNEI
jgi:hypothetical protein